MVSTGSNKGHLNPNNPRQVHWISDYSEGFFFFLNKKVKEPYFYFYSFRVYRYPGIFLPAGLFTY